MRGNSAEQPVNQSIEVNSREIPKVSTHSIAGYLIVGIPMVLLISVIGYKQYRILARRRRIEKLERLWHIDIDEKTY
ncbi:hypothetical protein [Calothrix sp. UHCC 0171]|uniref:hypothetical protein n=1 Tax=Calothrix sp. UHCC 0171 TaxID=3110245 RepID=UPI002B1ECDF7|nr:hypothetical protein [Calothrix sp. UHCC 0171]MEA5569793.1 hypothetical protein [Calothrix sp. UHCC 0171]